MGNSQYTQFNYEVEIKNVMSRIRILYCSKHKNKEIEYINKVNKTELLCKYCLLKHQAVIDIQDEIKFMNDQQNKIQQIYNFMLQNKGLIEIQKLYNYTQSDQIQVTSLQELVIKQHIQCQDGKVFFNPFLVQSIFSNIYKVKIKQNEQEQFELQEIPRFIPSIISSIQRVQTNIEDLIQYYSKDVLEQFKEIKNKYDFINFFSLLQKLKENSIGIRLKNLNTNIEVKEVQKNIWIILADQVQNKKIYPIQDNQINQQQIDNQNKLTKTNSKCKITEIISEDQQNLTKNKKINNYPTPYGQPNQFNQPNIQHIEEEQESILQINQNQMDDEKNLTKTNSKIKITEDQQSLTQNEKINNNALLNCDAKIEDQFIQFDVDSYYFGQLNSKKEKHGIGTLMKTTYDVDCNPKYFYFRGTFENDVIYGQGTVYVEKSKQVRQVGFFTQEQIDIQYFPKSKPKSKIVIREIVSKTVSKVINTKTTWKKFNQIFSSLDTQILNSSKWLNSSIIDAYVRHLCMEHQKEYLQKDDPTIFDRKFIFESHIMTIMQSRGLQCLDEFKQYILQFEPLLYKIWEFYNEVGFAINRNNTHWYFVKVNFKNKTILIQDSIKYHSSHYSNIAQLLSNIFRSLGLKDQLQLQVDQSCQQQRNAYQCGDYTCLHAFLFMNPNKGKNVNNIRMDILNLIQQ